MITGGSVTFSQSRKLADYENRSASFTFNITSEQDAVEETVQAAALAQSYVFNLLGIKNTASLIDPATGQKTPLVEGVNKTATEVKEQLVATGQAAKEAFAKANAPAPVEEKAKPKGKKPPTIVVIDKADPAGAPAEPAPAISTGNERVAPGDKDAGLEVPGFLDRTKPAADPAGAPVDDEWAAAPATIDDATLISALTTKNGELGTKNGEPGPGARAIRDLIAKYVQAPKGARDIEQGKRSAFILELKAL